MYPKFIELCESYKFLYKWNVSEILAREAAPEHPERIDTWFMMKVRQLTHHGTLMIMLPYLLYYDVLYPFLPFFLAFLP